MPKQNQISSRTHSMNTPQVSFDYFAFPRTGSHYFGLCLQGLYREVLSECGDSVKWSHTRSQEEKTRSNELRPLVLCLLKCGLSNRHLSSVRRNANPGGKLHEAPFYRGNKIVITIRHPYPTIHSLYKLLTERMRLDIGNIETFIKDQLNAYTSYYGKAAALQKDGAPVLFMRYEEMLQTKEPLAELCAFLQVEPKLPVGLVYFLTRFRVITKMRKRTFYAFGNNDAWKADTRYVDALSSIAPTDLTSLGYSV